MAPSGPDLPVSIEKERERAIELLSAHFAQDNLTLDDLERRIERVYRAASVPAIRDVVRDLPESTGAPVPTRPQQVLDPYVQERGRIVSVMASTKRRGFWRLPRELDIWAVMSETNLDLTQAELPSGVTEIDLHCMMAQVKVTVPPGVRVVLQVGAFMSEVDDQTVDPPRVGSGAPVVRLTGTAIMTELKVFTRTREVLDPGE